MNAERMVLKKDKELLARRKFLWRGIAVAVLVHFLGLALFKVEPVPGMPVVEDRSYLSLTSEEFGEFSRGSFDGIELLDSAPLFLPSQWNTTSRNVDSIRSRKPADLFRLYSPALSFGDSPAAAELSLNLEPIMDARESLLAGGRFPFASFGRVDRVTPGFPERFAQVMVYAYGQSEPVRQFEVGRGDLPEEVETGRYSAPTMAVSVHVSPTGILGPGFLVESSGNADIDRFFRRKATELIRESGGLNAGYYRIEIGP